MNSDIAVRKFTDRIPGEGRPEKIATYSFESTTIPAIEASYVTLLDLLVERMNAPDPDMPE